MNDSTAPIAPHRQLLYHFCRLQMPDVAMTLATFDSHLQRTFKLHSNKVGDAATWPAYVENLYATDLFLAAACLEGEAHAWDHLFAARASRVDCLLVDALRGRAVRLYPHNEEQQESAVTEFWSQLLVSDSEGSVPVLARYDGQRPLIPWLIRVFQNWHVSQLRHRAGLQQLPEEDLAMPLPQEPNGQWHEAFCVAARESFAVLADNEMLILGLRLRYRLSQRQVAHLLGIHEGNISRQISHLRDRCLEYISSKLLAQGWTGKDLSQYVLNEMGALLMNEPRMAADRLASLLALKGKTLPAKVTKE